MASSGRERRRQAVRLAFLLVPVLVASLTPLVTGGPASADGAGGPLCEARPGICPDTARFSNYEGEYVGHDEPSVGFYSDRTGAGNSSEWRLRLPHESSVSPTQDGGGGTWNFQEHPAFWFGMALCDTQSYPNPGMPCTPDSDANIRDDADPTSPNWIGHHTGAAFLELQFYAPGWAPFTEANSCDATKWCAAMVIWGLSENLTQFNNADCLKTAGDEWGDFAFVTKTGIPQASPDPLNLSAFVQLPDPTKVLFMNAGDDIAISIHDSPAGLVTALNDVTTGQSGLMTASVANGFAHPLFEPNAKTCSEEPYAFHPMYSTASEHTRVPWTAHSYNIAFSDEIGHFEYCPKANASLDCVSPGANDPKKDGDDSFCFNASDSQLVQVGGCQATDVDFDGTAYQPDWPGTLTDPAKDRQLHPESFLFTSPVSAGHNYDRTAFEADLPAIEASTLPGCSVFTGTGCVNPPAGAAFYPMFSTTGQTSCAWQEGGTHIPGTTNLFGGTPASEYGPTVGLTYAPLAGFTTTTTTLYSDFRNVLRNPCRSTGQLPN